MKLLENNWGKLRCPHCDSVMEIEKNDIETNFDGESFVVCPVCCSFIWVTNNNVVQKIKIGINYHR